MLLRYICEDNLAFQRVDGGPRVEAFSARQHVRQADIRYLVPKVSRSVATLKSDGRADCPPYPLQLLDGSPNRCQTVGQVLHTESGGPGPRCSARHRSSKAVVESSATSIGRISIKGVKWEWSAREPSAAGAGRVSTVSVLHGVPHRGNLWDEVAQRVDDELMGY
jgi:hypothetical protein